MSQEKLGEAIGLTFQQVQKYERGSNRISAGTLYRLGQVLDVPVSFFFDCYDDPHSGKRPARNEDGSSPDDSQISRREARLLRLWRAAPSNIADEMLSLLSSLSPHIVEPEGQPDAPAPALALGAQAERPAEVVEGPPPAVKLRTARVKAADSKKPRRRHGAVWDPADIYRNTKPTPRN